MKFLTLFLMSAFVAGFFTTGCAQTQPSYSTPDSLAQRIQAVENNLMGFVQIDGESPYTIAEANGNSNKPEGESMRVLLKGNPYRKFTDRKRK